MDINEFILQFKASENYKDLTNLLKNNYLFIPYKFYFYNTEHDASQLEIGLKILFNFINRYKKEDTHDLVVDKFSKIKDAIREICNEPKDNKKLAEEICTAINAIIHSYLNYNLPKKDLTIEDYLDYEFTITSAQYKINHISEIISYGLWREEYNYGKLYHNNVNRITPYSYSTFMKILLSKKFLKLRNELKNLAYKLIDSVNENGVGNPEITNKFIKHLEIFIDKQFMYLTDVVNVFDELRIYIENIFVNVLDKSNKTSKLYNIENIDDIPEIRTIMKAIDFYEDMKEEIFTRNIETRLVSITKIKQPVFKEDSYEQPTK